MPRKNQFTAEQDELLLDICRKIAEQTKFQFKQMQKQFNRKRKEREIYGQEKSMKAIYLRYNFLMDQKKIQWNYKLDQNLLTQASSNAKWSQIANKQPFKSRNITQNYLKQKFKTDMLRKFRTLLSKCGRENKKSEPSYIIFRQIMNLGTLEFLKKQQVITDSQLSTILKSVPFFQTSTYSGQDQRSTRSQKAISEMMNHLDPNVNIRELVNIIYNISTHSSNKKYLKLHSSSKCQQSLYIKRPTNQKDKSDQYENEGNFAVRYNSQDQIYQESMQEKQLNQERLMTSCSLLKEEGKDKATPVKNYL